MIYGSNLTKPFNTKPWIKFPFQGYNLFKSNQFIKPKTTPINEPSTHIPEFSEIFNNLQTEKNSPQLPNQLSLRYLHTDKEIALWQQRKKAPITLENAISSWFIAQTELAQNPSQKPGPEKLSQRLFSIHCESHNETTTSSNSRKVSN